jgi:hypothetical protein
MGRRIYLLKLNKMKKLNLFLTTLSLGMFILLSVAYWREGNHQASSGWGMAAIWCANSLLYQLRYEK